MLIVILSSNSDPLCPSSSEAYRLPARELTLDPRGEVAGESLGVATLESGRAFAFLEIVLPLSKRAFFRKSCIVAEEVSGLGSRLGRDVAEMYGECQLSILVCAVNITR